MKNVILIIVALFMSISNVAYAVDISIEELDAKLDTAYQEGIDTNKKTSDMGVIAKSTKKTWVWCSDNKCSYRKQFGSYKACYSHKKANGGFCY